MGLLGIPDLLFGMLVVPVALIGSAYLVFKLLDFIFAGRSWW